MSILPPPTQAVDIESTAAVEIERAIVRATFHDDQWAEIVSTFDVVVLAATLKKVIKDLGDQEQRWLRGIELGRDDETLTDDDFAARKRNFSMWRRSISDVRLRLRQRLNEIKPMAQAFIDEHQADRRALSILARRIWLWEEGLEDRLDDALDDWTISGTIGDLSRPRTTLREHVEDILANNGEVTP